MRTTIFVKHTQDGGIIAEMHIPEGNQLMVVLSGGNWEYDDVIEAENIEITELLLDAKAKGIFLNFEEIDFVRVRE